MSTSKTASSTDDSFSMQDDKASEKNEIKDCNKCLPKLRENAFMILVLVGVLLGFAIGFGVKTLTPSDVVQIWIEMPGTIYIRLLQLSILPLIASNLIIANLNPKEQGLNSIITFAFIISANVLSAAIGTTMATLIKPGVNVTLEKPTDDNKLDPNLQGKTSDVFADLLLNMFPDNIIGMTISQSKTVYKYKDGNASAGTMRVISSIASTNLIGVLLVSIFFGLAARAAGDRAEAFLAFFESIAAVVLKMVQVFLKATPIGVCFMIAGSVLKVNNISLTFIGLGMFIVTVTVGLGIQFTIGVLVYVAISFRNPFPLLRKCIKSWSISFATTSPIVSLPEMFQGCDEYEIDKSISRFACPLVVALKADGPGVFISSAAIFVAQTVLVDVPAGTTVVIFVLTAVSVLAIPHIPSASIVVTMTILASAGVDTNGAAYLFAVDWLLDRLRAGLVTLMTMYGTAMVDHIAKTRKHRKMEHVVPNTL